MAKKAAAKKETKTGRAVSASSSSKKPVASKSARAAGQPKSAGSAKTASKPGKLKTGKKSDEIPACLRGFGPPSLQPAWKKPAPKSAGLPKPMFLPATERDQWKKNIVTVSFFDAAAAGISGIADEVMKIASKWTDDILLKFVRSKDNDPSADIRVTFQGAGQYYSLIGSQSKQGTTPSMNLGFRPGTPDWERPEERRRLVLHEFGHALGLNHEHKHPSMNLDLRKVIDHYTPLLRGYGPAQIQQQFVALSQNEIDPKFLEFSKDPDPDSIMMYEIPAGISDKFPAGIKGGNDLSKKDREGIVKLYGSDEVFAPGPQGLDIVVGSEEKRAYWLFGKDKGLFHVRIDAPGDYEILVRSDTRKDDPKVIDPFAGIPLPYVPDSDIFKLGTRFEIYEPDSKAPNSKGKTPIAGMGFVVTIPKEIKLDTDLSVFSKVVRFEKKGLFFIEVTNETADVLQNDVSRFILQIRRK